MESAEYIALITGGKGTLAKGIAGVFEGAGMDVLTPGRGELDVVCGESVDGYFSELDKVDLLVCNAGVIDDKVLAKMPEESWDRVMDANLKGAFLAARAAAKLMIRQRPSGGHIVFVSSFAAFHPGVGQAAYGAAKAALSGFAKSLAQELGGRNIRVNVIVPGFMETKMTANLPEAVVDSARGKHALGVFNTPEAVGRFLRTLHLEMPATSGQVFNLDSRIL